MASRSQRPVLAVSIIALLPAVALGGLALLAQGKTNPAKAAPPGTTVPQQLPATLATPLLSVRRSPGSLADDRRADLLVETVGPLAAAIDASSCLTVGYDDRALVARNGDLAVIPASNLKIITAAVAIDVLGPGFTFTTTVVGPAPVDGVIDGDVYLVGGGDPVLSEAWYTQPSNTRKRPPMHATRVEGLVDALVASGVTRITGEVLGDGSRYDDEQYPPGWADAVRVSADGGAVGALVVNDSVSPAGAQGDDPAASAATTFVELLVDRGIEVEGGAGTGVATVGLGVLASVQSVPLSSIVNEVLATSDNLAAEMLVKEIGVAAVQRGTRVDGLQAMSARLATWGVPMDGLVFTDGSGLSHDNQLTCSALAAVLQRGTATDAVGTGLARAGQDGSTLADSFEQPGLVDVLQAKTGTLHTPNEVKALSGYFLAGTDEVAFVLILNGPTALAYAAAWDQLGTALVATAAGPTADVLAPRT